MTDFENKKLVKSVFGGLKAWTKFSLMWLLLTFVLRLGFFFVMLSKGLIQSRDFLTILSGVYFDFVVVLEISAIALLPLLIINWLMPKVAKTVSVAFITLYVVVYGCLIGYYSNVNLPLDRVFLVYGLGEIYNIVVSSVNFSLLPLFGVLVIIALYVVFVRFWVRKINVRRPLATAYFIVAAVFVIFFDHKELITNDKNYKSYQDYCLAVNQLAYTLNDFGEYWKEKSAAEDFTSYDKNVIEDARNYQSLFPDFSYVDIHYPFMRKSDDADVLGGLMNVTTDGKAPDFVFVIVESLGQRLSSTRPKMSFTPFLDSLKNESLYWPNCLALAERTFGAVPNIFSSAPYDKTGFARVWFPMPDHNSILKEMSLNGYSLSFYYGGNASFDGQDEYMRGNGVGFIMKPDEQDFDAEQKERMQKENCWGMYDRDMFNAAIRHRDATERNRPNTDIYITLSTHEPYIFSESEEYVRKVEEMVAETMSFGPNEKNTVLTNKDNYASFLYMDDCVRMLFEYYKSQPEFENTVFVILGDHRMGRVYVNSSPLLKYNVPLLIYSPLLKEPKTFKAVVTHHDIAPTVTAYLSNNYDYVSADECHWLGTSLDTSVNYRCRQSVAFMRNSREEIEYLHGDYMIERDRLFKVSDSLIVDEINDDKVKDSLTEYLRRYKNVDWFVTQNDYLWKKTGNVVELYSETRDSFTKNFVENEYFDIMEPLKFKQGLEKIYLDVEFDYKNSGADLEKVFSEFRIKGPGVDFFRGFKFSNLSTDNGDGYLHYMAKTTFFLAGNDVRNAKLAIDIFSKTAFDFECRDLKIKIEGLPLNLNY